MKITVFTKKGEIFKYENVNNYELYDCGPGLLIIRHEEHKMDYFRLGYINLFSVEEV